MARAISFTSKELKFEAQITKLDRNKVYGYVKTRTLDPDGKDCQTAYILDDGKTIIPGGGFSLRLLSAEGNEISRSSLTAVNKTGEPLSMHPSVFDGEVQLYENYTLDDYLNLEVSSVYQLDIDEATKKKLTDYLSSGKFLAFDFNYRAGYSENLAFLIAASGEIFAVVGQLTVFEFLTLEQVAVEDEVTNDVADDFEEDDFAML